MGNRYDAIDWQTFSQKKDIEEIAKNTREKKDIQLTAVVEICLVIVSIAADNVFGDKVSILWGGIGILSIIPIAILLFRYLIAFVNKNKPGRDIPNAKEMIDVFDNETCYCVLMAESYSRKLVNQEKSQINKFYFIETCFYLNKAIYNLSSMSNCVDTVFSKDIKNLYQTKTISLTRLYNLFAMIDNIFNIIDEKKRLIEDIDIDGNYVLLYERYKKEFEDFRVIIKLQFEENLFAN